MAVRMKCMVLTLQKKLKGNYTAALYSNIISVCILWYIEIVEQMIEALDKIIQD